MAFYFYDTSAIAKQYFDEVGSEQMDRLIVDTDSAHLCSPLALIEVTSAICRRLYTSAANDALERFHHDTESIFEITTVDDATFERAIILVRRHRLRGCDALQLANALQMFQVIPDLIFVCSDIELNAAAGAEGLAVLNPNEF